jgi:hypothetical protein
MIIEPHSSRVYWIEEKYKETWRLKKAYGFRRGTALAALKNSRKRHAGIELRLQSAEVSNVMTDDEVPKYTRNPSPVRRGPYGPSAQVAQ